MPSAADSGGQQGHFALDPQCKGAPKLVQILAVQIEKYDLLKSKSTTKRAPS